MAIAPAIQIDDAVDASPYSVPWWLRTLENALVARMRDIDQCEAYYAGHHNLAFATSKYREAFGSLFRAFSDNWTELVVDSSVERISVQGFRFDKEDPTGDDDAWSIWQANNLDSESVIAHTMAVKTGQAYIIVGPGVDEPEVTIEHPCEVIVSTSPGNRRNRQAALKRWVDDLGYLNWYLYLPEAVYSFRSESELAGGGYGPSRPVLQDVVTNPLGVVPVVPLVNDPDGRGYGTSDIAQVIPTQDAVNKLLADALVASEFGAYPQRYATGLEVPEDDFGRKLISDFASGASRLWTIEDPDAKLGSLPATDLGNFVKLIETIVQHIAARTRTPPHYLLGQSGNFPSGDSLKATETGLVAKVRKKHIFFGEAWTDAMRLAFLLKGDSKRGGEMAAKTIWKDPESRSFGELVDGVVKMATIGVPEEILWEKLGYSPQEIGRMQQMQADKVARDARALAAMPAPTVPPTGLPGDPAAPEAQVARPAS